MSASSLQGKALERPCRTSIRIATVATVLGVYMLISLANAFTRRPGCDEGWFADPALTLATKGYMGTPVLEPANSWENGRNLNGIDRYTYWILPLNLVVQAGWYRIAGFSLFAMRFLSILWGLAAMAAWYIIMRKLFADERIALLTVVLVGFDYAFLRSAANGRMDMMGAALSFGAVAAYLSFREQSLPIALLSGHTLAAAALFTHPNGLLCVLSLIVLTLLFDRQRLHSSLGAQFSLAALVALPYLLGAAGWGAYILQNPPIFLSQFRGNAAGRLGGLHSPLAALRAEIDSRYLGGGQPLAKLLMFVPYVLGIAVVCRSSVLRRNRGIQFLLAAAAIDVIYFWLFEGTKLYLYVVYLTPILCAILAGTMVYCWSELPRLRIAMSVVAAFLIGLNLMATAYTIRRNDFRYAYSPAIAYLKGHAAAPDLVMGSAELGFELSFSDQLMDDVRLGFFSKKRPQWVVVEQRYDEWFHWAKRNEPETYRYIEDLLGSHCRQVFRQGTYTIYGCPMQLHDAGRRDHVRTIRDAPSRSMRTWQLQISNRCAILRRSSRSCLPA